MFFRSLISLSIFLLLYFFAHAARALEVQAERGAVIVHVQGKVWLQSQGKKSPAAENARAYVGDVIATESASRAIVLLDGSTTVRLDEKTSLTIASPSQENSFWCKVKVSSGRIWMEVNRLIKGEKKRDPIEVETPTGLAAVHGTVLQVDVEGNESEITVHEGSVQVGDQEIQSGETGRMTPRGFRRGEYKLGKFAEWNFEEALQAQSSKMEKIIRLILHQYINNPKARERMSRWIVSGTVVEQTPQELVVSVSASARQTMKKAQKMRQKMKERRFGKKSDSFPESSDTEGDSELITMRIPKEKLEGIVVYVDGQAATLEAVRPGQPFSLVLPVRSMLVGTLPSEKVLTEQLPKEVVKQFFSRRKGTIKGVDMGSRTVTLSTPEGETSLRLAPKVTVFINKKRAAIEDLKPGVQIFAMGRGNKVSLILGQ